MDLVDVGLLGREGDIGLDLIADGAEEGVVDQLGDDAVLVGSGRGIGSCVAIQDGSVEQVFAEAGLGFLLRESLCGVSGEVEEGAVVGWTVQFLDRFLSGFLSSTDESAFLFMLNGFH